MMDVTRSVGGKVVIEIAGTFDGKAASRLSGWLCEVPKTEPLVLDFTRVRECQDFGLAAVARDLATRVGQLEVRGLTRHHERMLRYFGVDLGRVDAGVRGEEEALG